jgi:hypothetical protein
MSFSDMKIEINSRETATSYPTLSWLENDLQTSCAEEIYGVNEIVKASGPTALSLGTIAKVRFVFISVIEDTVNGREPLSVMINGASNDAWKGTTFAYEADVTTGVTSIHLSNASTTNAVKYRFYLAGA